MSYYMLKVCSRLLCLLPYRAVLALGRILGRIYYAAAARQRLRAIDQIRERLNLSPDQADRTIRQLFIHLAQTALEILYLPALNKENIQRYIQIENRHYLDQALAQGKGVAVLAAHLGNWEWLGAGLALYGYPVASIIKPQPSSKQVTSLVNEYRRQAGIQLFGKGTSDVVGVARALKQGKVIGFFSDQDAGRHGLFIEVLGKMASVHTGIAIFARKLNCPVIPAFIVRNADGGHRILVQPPQSFECTGDAAGDVERFSSRMSGIIESVIREYPGEWLWFQKRWRTQPPGEKAGAAS